MFVSGGAGSSSPADNWRPAEVHGMGRGLFEGTGGRAPRLSRDFWHGKLGEKTMTSGLDRHRN
jgi:hypothetical protein